MTLWGLEFQRLDGRYHKPVIEIIPANESPVQELDTLLSVMRDEIGARIAEMSPGRYAMHLTEADQCWSVRIVSVGDPGKTQEMATVIVYDADGNELDSMDKAV